MNTQNLNEIQTVLESDGWCIAKDAVSSNSISEIRTWLDQRREEAVNKPSLEPEFETEPNNETISAVRKLRRLFWDDPKFWTRIFESEGVFDIARKLVGPRPALVFHAAFLKPAKVGSRVVFHQDQALWSRDYPRSVNMWLALVPTDLGNGCLKFCTGSHRAGLIEHKMFEDSKFHIGVDPEELGYIADPAIMTEGDIAIWGRYMIHGSDANSSPKGRDSVVMVFVDSQSDNFNPTDCFLLPEVIV